MKYVCALCCIVLLSFPMRVLAQEERAEGVGHNAATGGGAAVLNLLYFPLKFPVAIAGAVVGGVTGFLTGGDEESAEGIWQPLVGGNYFFTSNILKGKETFSPLGGVAKEEPKGQMKY